MHTGKTKTLTIVVYAVSAAIFAALAVVSAFCDLEISRAVADVDFGAYYSENAFARFFETAGEMPLYLFLSFAVCVFIRNLSMAAQPSDGTSNRYKPLIIAAIVVLAVLLIGIGYYAVTRVDGYIRKLNGLEANTSALNSLVLAVTAVALSAAIFFSVELIPQKYVRALLPFAVAIVLVAAISQAAVQGLKAINSRLRYRGMTYEYDFDFSDFTPWYQWNGKLQLTELQNKYGLPKDALRSFPSGHTVSAGITFSLLVLPLTFKRLNKTKHYVWLAAIAVGYTVLVAYSRMLMGAHYLSDVTFGALAAFVGFVLARLILKKLPFTKRIIELPNKDV